MGRPHLRVALSLGLLALAGLQLAAAQGDFRALMAEISRSAPKKTNRSAPTPEVRLERAVVVQAGQKVTLALPVAGIGSSAKAYVNSPFVTHAGQRLVGTSRLELDLSVAPDAWPGVIDGTLVSLTSGREAYFEAIRIPGRLQLELTSATGVRIRLTQVSGDPDGNEEDFNVEFFRGTTATAFFRTTASVKVWFGTNTAPEGSINAGGRENDVEPPCSDFELDLDSIGPGRPTFTGRLTCGDTANITLTGSAKRLP